MSKNIIKSYPFVSFDDNHNYCESQQIIYQKDMTKSVAYAEDYFYNYVRRVNTKIAKKLNKARVDISHKYCKCILDVGIGCGEFIENCKIKTYGYDINHIGINWLKKRNLFVDPYQEIPEEVDGFTFWDVIEHMPEPQTLFGKLPSKSYLFTCLPIFKDITKFKESKHFRPNEHYYYWTKDGFIRFMTDSGFDFIEWNDLETQAGRENVLTFCFRKI
jgi:hypothetical protein